MEENEKLLLYRYCKLVGAFHALVPKCMSL